MRGKGRERGRRANYSKINRIEKKEKKVEKERDHTYVEIQKKTRYRELQN